MGEPRVASPAPRVVERVPWPHRPTVESHGVVACQRIIVKLGAMVVIRPVSPDIRPAIRIVSPLEVAMPSDGQRPLDIAMSSAM